MDMDTRNDDVAAITRPLHTIDALKARLAEINKRARRIGAAPLVLTVGEPRKVKILDRTEIVVDCTLTGAVVSFGGWRLVARVDLIDGDRIVSRAQIGDETTIPDTTGECHHCRTRRDRRVVYVVAHAETGATKTVGSSCLPDFTGLGRSAEHVIALGLAGIEALEQWDDGEGEARARAYDLDALLTWAACAIRQHGWVSKASASLAAPSTHTRVMHALGDRTGAAGRALTRSDRAVALRAIHWAAVLSGSDYEENIATIARAGWAMPRHGALAISIVSAYLRHRGTLTAGTIRRDHSATVGQPGAAIEAEAIVTAKTQHEGAYGLTTRVELVTTTEGATLVWWASGDTDDFALGATLTVAAKVKAHGDYRGARQTVITRATAVRAWVPERKTRKSKAA